MQFKKLYLLLAMSLILVIAACGNGGDADEDTTEGEEGTEESADNADGEGSADTVEYHNDFTIGPPRGEEGDGDGEEVDEVLEIPKNPENVVIFDLGVATTFPELGIEENIAGLPKGEDNSTLSEELEVFESDDYQNLGGLFEPDYEAIAEIQPELIILHGRQSNSEIISELESAAPDAQIINTSADSENYFEDVKESTLFLGELFEVEDEAQELVDELDTKLDDVHANVEDLDETMLFVQTNGGDLSFHGPGGRYDFLYSELGLTSAGEQEEDEEGEEATGNHGNQISFEFITETNPGLILVMDRGAAVSDGDETSVDILDNDVTSEVDAIANDNVTELNPITWYMNAGGYGTAMSQLDEIQEAVDNAQ